MQPEVLFSLTLSLSSPPPCGSLRLHQYALLFTISSRCPLQKAAVVSINAELLLDALIFDVLTARSVIVVSAGLSVHALTVHQEGQWPVATLILTP